MRSKNTIEVLYGFGDVSTEGACMNHQQFVRLKLENRIHYCYRHWCAKDSKASSNYRELLNLVERLEAQVKENKLKDVEVFIFTNNSTMEAIFYKGNSILKRLFNLVL